MNNGLTGGHQFGLATGEFWILKPFLSSLCKMGGDRNVGLVCKNVACQNHLHLIDRSQHFDLEHQIHSRWPFNFPQLSYCDRLSFAFTQLAGASLQVFPCSSTLNTKPAVLHWLNWPSTFFCQGSFHWKSAVVYWESNVSEKKVCGFRDNNCKVWSSASMVIISFRQVLGSVLCLALLTLYLNVIILQSSITAQTGCKDCL